MVGALQSNFKSTPEILDKHKESLRDIQKAFTDSSDRDNAACQPFAALLAWAQNYPFYIQHVTQLLKLNSDVAKAAKELEFKQEKIANIKGVVAQIDSNIALLQKSVDEDNNRLSHYQEINAEMQENVRAEQANYLNFEKIFFSELEQFVIKKKMSSSFKPVNRQ